MSVLGPRSRHFLLVRAPSRSRSSSSLPFPLVQFFAKRVGCRKKLGEKGEAHVFSVGVAGLHVSRFVEGMFFGRLGNASRGIDASKEVLVNGRMVETGLDGLVGGAPGDFPLLELVIVIELAAEHEELGVESSHELGRDGMRALHASGPVGSARLVQGHGFVDGAGEGEGVGVGGGRRLQDSGPGPALDQVNGLVADHHGMHPVPFVVGQRRQQSRHRLCIPAAHIVARALDGHGPLPYVVDGRLHGGALELAVDGEALLVLGAEDGAQAAEAVRDGDGVVRLGGGHGGVEEGEVAAGAVVELLQRLGAGVAVHGSVGPEEAGQQGVLAAAQAAIGKEEDLVQAGQLAVVGAAQEIQALVRLSQQRAGAGVDEGGRAALEGGMPVPGDGGGGGRGGCMVLGLVGLEAGDDVAAEVGARSGIGQIRGFAQEGAQQMQRLAHAGRDGGCMQREWGGEWENGRMGEWGECLLSMVVE